MMKLAFYLVVNNNGTTRTCKKKPDLAWNEISIAMRMELPDSLFTKPQLSATITVPNEAAMQQAIEAVTTDNVKAAIETAAGMKVRIDIVTPDRNT